MERRSLSLFRVQVLRAKSGLLNRIQNKWVLDKKMQYDSTPLYYEGLIIKGHHSSNLDGSLSSLRPNEKHE